MHSFCSFLILPFYWNLTCSYMYLISRRSSISNTKSLQCCSINHGCMFAVLLTLELYDSNVSKTISKSFCRLYHFDSKSKTIYMITWHQKWICNFCCTSFLILFNWASISIFIYRKISALNIFVPCLHLALPQFLLLDLSINTEAIGRRPDLIIIELSSINQHHKLTLFGSPNPETRPCINFYNLPLGMSRVILHSS